jgi:hypothetical protein
VISGSGYEGIEVHGNFPGFRGLREEERYQVESIALQLYAQTPQEGYVQGLAHTMLRGPQKPSSSTINYKDLPNS